MVRHCVGCGYCCSKAACTMGVDRFNLTNGERCPGLYFDTENKRYKCSIYDFTTWKREFGLGCSSSLNTWRSEVKLREI